jgi:hypothetical protein
MIFYIDIPTTAKRPNIEYKMTEYNKDTEYKKDTESSNYFQKNINIVELNRKAYNNYINNGHDFIKGEWICFQNEKLFSRAFTAEKALNGIRGSCYLQQYDINDIPDSLFEYNSTN